MLVEQYSRREPESGCVRVKTKYHLVAQNLHMSSQNEGYYALVGAAQSTMSPFGCSEDPQVSTSLMRKIPRGFVALFALLIAMVVLMWQPIREEVATRDEPLCLGAGYTYLKGMGLHIDPA
jgi:hypothetical protein